MITAKMRFFESFTELEIAREALLTLKKAAEEVQQRKLEAFLTLQDKKVRDRTGDKKGGGKRGKGGAKAKKGGKKGGALKLEAVPEEQKRLYLRIAQVRRV